MSGLVRATMIVATLLAAGAANVDAQGGVVRGHVLRADGPLGLADAELVLSPSGATTRSDARGAFAFRDVVPGRVELSVSRVGFAPAVVQLQVDASAVTQLDIAMQPVPTILDPIITTGTGSARSLSQVAAAVSVADTSAIQRDRTVGLHETLRMMPGVEAASRYGTDEVRIGIRGSAARARQAVRGVAVLLDGIPLTEPDGVARLDLIELSAARQVEVVRGPASALYAGSPGGVVNIVSRSGRDSRGVVTRAQRGAFGFEKYDGRAGGVFAGQGSWFAAASYTSIDGYRAHSDGTVLRGHTSVDYLAGSATGITVQASASSLDTRLPGSQTQSEFDADPWAAAPVALASGFGRADNRYRAGVRLEQAVGIGAATGYFFFGGRTLGFPIPTEIVDGNLHRYQGGVRLRTGRITRMALDATVGIDYDDVIGRDRRWANVQGTRGILRDSGEFSVSNLGGYSQLEWHAMRMASMIFGLRYDQVRYRFASHVPPGIPEQTKTFDQLSPRISAVWTPTSRASLYASAGRGFEVPAIGEISASPGAPLLASLRPKSLWNYETGVRLLGERARFQGSVFYARVRGEFVPRTVDNVSLPENASRSRNVGVELSGSVRATSRLEVAAAYTFLDLRLKDYTSAVLDSTGTLRDVDFSGKQLPAVPMHRATADLRLHAARSLELGVQAEWQGVVHVATSNARAGTWYVRPGPSAPVEGAAFRAVPARALLHLNAEWRVGAVAFFGSAENVFDKRYVGSVLANEAGGRFYQAGAPAWVSLGIKVALAGRGA